jgi:cell division protein FtsL
MSQQWWRRFLPERSQFWILAVAVIVVVSVASFANLATARGIALGEKQLVQMQVDQLKEQNRRLKQALEQVKQGENVEPKAREYFGMGYPGETQVVAESVPTPVGPPQAPDGPVGPPYWLEWWKRLTAP